MLNKGVGLTVKSLFIFIKNGIESVLQNIDGVFAFVLIDTIKKKIYVARDPYGV